MGQADIGKRYIVTSLNMGLLFGTRCVLTGFRQVPNQEGKLGGPEFPHFVALDPAGDMFFVPDSSYVMLYSEAVNVMHALTASMMKLA